MNFFASDETKKIKLKSGIEIDVRSDISKRTFNSLIASIPQTVDSDRGFTPSQANDFTIALFKVFVVSWNLDREPSTESYLELKRANADEIDEALTAHFT